MALEMQNFEALSPPVVKKITWWTLLSIFPHRTKKKPAPNGSYLAATEEQPLQLAFAVLYLPVSLLQALIVKGRT